MYEAMEFDLTRDRAPVVSIFIHKVPMEAKRRRQDFDTRMMALEIVKRHELSLTLARLTLSA